MSDLSPLDWPQFLSETERYSPETFGIAELKALVTRLSLDPAFVEPHIHFTDASYTRNLIHKNDLFEAIVLCWSGEQATSIHNHGDSFGVMAIYDGVLCEEIFRRSDEDPAVQRVHLDRLHRQHHAPGTVSSAPRGMIHRLINEGGKTVSVHFYAGPLDTMEVFDPESGTIERTPMNYYRSVRA